MSSNGDILRVTGSDSIQKERNQWWLEKTYVWGIKAKYRKKEGQELLRQDHRKQRLDHKQHKRIKDLKII